MENKEIILVGDSLTDWYFKNGIIPKQLYSIKVSLGTLVD